MAVIARGKNVVMEHVSGKLAKTVVYKQYVDKIVMAKYPDMSKVKHTEKQKGEQSRFQKAVAYAKQVLATPAKKRAYLKKTEKGAHGLSYSDCRFSKRKGEGLNKIVACFFHSDVLHQHICRM